MARLERLDGPVRDEAAIHWRDRLALRIMAWIAAVLMTDAIAGDEREEFDALCTSIHVESRWS